MEQIRPDIRVEESTPLSGRIVLGPLEKGYGVTLGNALRRVLLSSIKGAAITAVRVEGILHEFSTMPGIREDAIELLLNLKNVALKIHSGETRVLRLEAKGPCVVTPENILPDSDVEFVNPDVYICTLEEGASLDMDLFVETGTGYVTSDRGRPADLPVDALVVDAVFSPVRRVKYEVQDARVGQRTDYERLVLEIWTNGSVTPERAAIEASGILQRFFSMLYQGLGEDESGINGEIDIPPGSEPAAVDGDLLRSIKDLELSIRSENCLLRGGVQTFGDLMCRTKAELLKIRNLGKISLREIEEKLEPFGLNIKGEEPEEDEDDILKEDEAR
ncbi:MAG: DNA-directed RNA polymerase subunit alpha [Thermovirgaceae bacterium]|nr:DNA-directed RNA polymerase subunit alpha [Thermovirgaceae bacterium]